jgi:hypothetical protein
MGTICIVDAGIVDNIKGTQIFKFSPEGQMLLALGRRVDSRDVIVWGFHWFEGGDSS